MQIKKAGGKIFGASLTAAEQKAMNMEIQRQLVEYDRKTSWSWMPSFFGNCTRSSALVQSV